MWKLQEVWCCLFIILDIMMQYKHLKCNLKIQDYIKVAKPDMFWTPKGIVVIDNWRVVEHNYSKWYYLLLWYKYRGLISMALGFGNRPVDGICEREIIPIAESLYCTTAVEYCYNFPMSDNIEDISNLVDRCIGKIKERWYKVFINNYEV